MHMCESRVRRGRCLPLPPWPRDSLCTLVSRSQTIYAPAAYRCPDYKRHIAAGACNRDIDKRLARIWSGYARLYVPVSLDMHPAIQYS